MQQNKVKTNKIIVLFKTCVKLAEIRLYGLGNVMKFSKSTFVDDYIRTNI